MFLSVIRQSDIAINQAQQAVNLDPLSASAHHSLGDVYKNLYQFEKSIESFQRALELDPQSRSALNSMAWAYFEMGEHQKAISIFEDTYSKTDSVLKGVTQLAFAYGKLGKRKKALELLSRLYDRQKQEPLINLDGDFAIVYAGLGEYDKVFEYLEKSFNERQGHLLFIRTPHWKGLFDDARFKSLIKRMGL